MSILPPTPADPPTSPAPELTPEQIVASPAVDGDLDQEMRQVAKPFGKLTMVLAGVVVLAGVFAGGAWTHAAFGSSSTTPSARPAAAAGGTGRAPAGTGGRQGGTARGGTTGTVDRVDGTTVYLKTAQGAEVTVSTTDSTTVGLLQPGKLTDLKPGANITVQGQPGTDGGVAAQAITQQPARAGG